MDSTCYSKKEPDIIHFVSQLINSFFTTHKRQAFDSPHKALKNGIFFFPHSLFYFAFFKQSLLFYIPTPVLPSAPPTFCHPLSSTSQRPLMGHLQSLSHHVEYYIFYVSFIWCLEITNLKLFYILIIWLLKI